MGDGAWPNELRELVRTLERKWSVRAGTPFPSGGRMTWVAPATRADGTNAVLKIARRHAESMHEADGLRVWDGDGTVQIYAVEETPETTALLLERCMPGTPLGTRPEPEQDAVIARLLPRLWRAPAAGHPFRSLQAMCDAWADEFEAKVAEGDTEIDRGLAREGIALFRELPATADRGVLLCTDLHAANVLAAEREPWLVIDPKPYVGDPAYDVVQHMLNCKRLWTDPLGLAARMADLLSLDRGRVRLWLFARCVQESPETPGLAEVAHRLSPHSPRYGSVIL
jgi:streptomycin 6-kinase